MLRGRDLDVSFVAGCASLRTPSAVPMHVHRHDGYEIAYMVSGRTRWLLDDGTVLELPGRSFSLVQPGVSHRGVFDRIDPCVLAWLAFSPRRGVPHKDSLLPGPLLRSVDATFAAAGNVVRRGTPRLHAAAEALIEHAEADRPEDEPLNRARLRIAVAQIILEAYGVLSGATSPGGPSGADLLERLTGFVRDHLREDIGVGDMARHVGMSESAFFDAFRDCSGTTPADYVCRARISAAETLLLQTKEPVKRIAREVGFRSGHYFSSCFRRFTGTTPSAFRLGAAAGPER
jgi:AraC-like DNA-binding protein